MVSKKDFLAYEKVRRSGVTNMLAKDLVCKLAKISEKAYFEILNNYEKLAKEYLKK